MTSIVTAILQSCCHNGGGGGFDFKDDESISTLSVLTKKNKRSEIMCASSPLGESPSVVNTTNSSASIFAALEISHEADETDEAEAAISTTKKNSGNLMTITASPIAVLETSNLTEDCIVQEADADDEEWYHDSDSLLHMTDDEEEQESGFVYHDEYGSVDDDSCFDDLPAAVAAKEGEQTQAQEPIAFVYNDEFAVYKDIPLFGHDDHNEIISETATVEEDDYSASSSFVSDHSWHNEVSFETGSVHVSAFDARTEPEQEKPMLIAPRILQVLPQTHQHQTVNVSNQKKKKWSKGIKKRFSSLLNPSTSSFNNGYGTLPSSHDSTSPKQENVAPAATATTCSMPERNETFSSPCPSSTFKSVLITPPRPMPKDVLETTTTVAVSAADTTTIKKQEAKKEPIADSVPVVTPTPSPDESPAIILDDEQGNDEDYDSSPELEEHQATPKVPTATISNFGPNTSPQLISMDDDADAELESESNTVTLHSSDEDDDEESFGPEDVDPSGDHGGVTTSRIIKQVKWPSPSFVENGKSPLLRTTTPPLPPKSCLDVDKTPKMKNLRKQMEDPTTVRTSTGTTKKNGLFSFWEQMAAANGSTKQQPVVGDDEDQQLVQELEESFDFSDPDLEDLGIPLEQQDCWMEFTNAGGFQEECASV